MFQIEAQITEMSTPPRSVTIRHEAYPTVGRQSRSATGGDDMKPGMSVALLRGNALQLAASCQGVQLLDQAKRQQSVSFKACRLGSAIYGRFDDSGRVKWRDEEAVGVTLPRIVRRAVKRRQNHRVATVEAGIRKE